MVAAELTMDRARTKWIDPDNQIREDSVFDQRIKTFMTKRKDQIERGRWERLRSLE